VSVVMEQFLRMLIHCGMPASDVDFINCGGRTMGELITRGPYRVTQFTGKVADGSEVAEAKCA